MTQRTVKPLNPVGHRNVITALEWTPAGQTAAQRLVLSEDRREVKLLVSRLDDYDNPYWAEWPGVKDKDPACLYLTLREIAVELGDRAPQAAPERGFGNARPELLQWLKKLVSLLEHPEPGIASWRIACENVWKHIVKEG